VKPLASCANGCGVPPSPPSLVICGKCLDKIGARLARWARQGYVDGDPARSARTGAASAEARRGDEGAGR